MKTPWRWWRERQATDKTCKHLALMTEDITNITDRLVAFVWEDIEKIIDQMSEDLLRPIESIKPIKKNVMKDLLSCEGRRRTNNDKECVVEWYYESISGKDQVYSRCA